MIKFASNITDSRKSYIINGLRSLVAASQGGVYTIVIDVLTILKGYDAMNQSFTMVVVLTAIISIIISFFLLLISTSSNINDSIWEYGVLRSMGITKA